jgi:phosphoribosyl 1,2-cyclic phosphodiesterase
LQARQELIRGHVLFSHTHWDHIQGWPFFLPAFQKGNKFTLHALAGINHSLDRVMANQMEYTYFPVRLDEMNSQISFDEVREGRVSIEGAKVTAHYLNHTSICLGYRIEADGKSVVYASDTEPHGFILAAPEGERDPRADQEPRFVHEEDRRLADFVQGADLLILDAQYTDDEYTAKVGWGHSTTSYATDIGILGKVARLALFHHDPVRSDAELDDIVSTACQRAAMFGSRVQIFGAAEGMTVQL